MKKSTLADAFKKSTGEQTPSVNKVDEVQKPTQASRQNKKSINAYIDPAGIRELKILVADTGLTLQELYREALNDLLVKYGKKPLA